MTDLVIRARRAVTPAGEQPCAVVVDAGRIVAVLPHDEPSTPPRRRRPRRRARRRRGAAARSGRHPRARQRARPHRVGGLRLGHPGGRRRRRDDPRRHAAEQHPADHRRSRRWRSSGRPPRDQACVDVGFWGGAVPGNLADLRRAARRRASSASSASCCTPGSTSSPTSTPTSSRRRCARSPPRRAADRARRGRATPSTHAAHRAGAGLRRLPRARARAARRTSPIAQVDRARPRGPGPGSTCCTCPAPTPCRCSRGRARDGRAAHAWRPARTTSPSTAEEIPDGATQFKCCPPIREAENREALWAGPAPTATIDCVVTDHSPVHRRPQAPRHRRLRRAPGAASPPCSSGCPRCGPQARRRGHALADVVALDGARRPPASVGLTTQGRASRSARDADFAVFAPDDAFVVDAGAAAPPQPGHAYAGRPLAGVVRSTWLAGAADRHQRRPAGPAAEPRSSMSRTDRYHVPRGRPPRPDAS